MSKTVEDIGTLKINLLTQAQYDAEKAEGRLEDDELYLTPSSGTGVSDVEVNGNSVVNGGVAEIALKTINQNPIVGSGDITITGGASAYIAEYGVTSYADVKTAYDDDAIILCAMTSTGETALFQMVDFDATNQIFYFTMPYRDGTYWSSISNANGWDNGVFEYASTDVATTTSRGLMSQTDKTKLNGIASGAEVNVQSNWSQSDSTADDYIKNKPTIPTKVSDLTNDAGYITGYTETDPTVPSWAKQSSKPSYTFSEIGSKPTTVSGYGITDAKISSGTITLGSDSINLIDMFYPVGSYYETSDSTFNPNITWGGTWGLETEGQVHVSAGENYEVGDTGGEATHTLTIDEMPSHNHNTTVYRNGTQYGWHTNSTGNTTAYNQISSQGGGQAHNNMQPYIVVNRWHRTA